MAAAISDGENKHPKQFLIDRNDYAAYAGDYRYSDLAELRFTAKNMVIVLSESVGLVTDILQQP